MLRGAVGSRRDALLNWLATGPSVGGVVATLLVYDVVQRVALRRGPEAHQRAVSGMARWANRAARLAGTRFRATGLEHVAPGRNYIIASNHQSVLDIAMTSEYLAALQPRYVSKRELARGVPGVSYNLRHGGSVLIDRGAPEQARAAIDAVARRVRDDGWSVLIFPEGTRSKTGAMRPFRAGGLRALVAGAPGVPVLPVTTAGGSRLFKFNMAPVVRNVELSYTVHPPVAPPDPADEPAFDAFVARLAATIESALPDDDREGRA
jgi:1-acyl-sn-glycerol-3-phosphate acyltransferase